MKLIFILLPNKKLTNLIEKFIIQTKYLILLYTFSNKNTMKRTSNFKKWKLQLCRTHKYQLLLLNFKLFFYKIYK